MNLAQISSKIKPEGAPGHPGPGFPDDGSGSGRRPLEEISPRLLSAFAGLLIGLVFGAVVQRTRIPLTSFRLGTAV